MIGIYKEKIQELNTMKFFLNIRLERECNDLTQSQIVIEETKNEIKLIDRKISMYERMLSKGENYS